METAWLDNLKTIDAAGLASFYPEAANAARNAAAELPDGLAHRRRATKRRTLHQLQVANAAKQLDRLPEDGESIHCVMKGNFPLWCIVAAVLRLAEPVTIAHLSLATLGFNRQNCQELVELLDSGKVQATSFICSTFFKAKDADDFGFLFEQLTSRGHRVAAVRSHAKILGFAMTDGRAFVVESSANLRACRMAEVFSMHHDAALLDFHRGWMDTLLTEATR